MKKHYGKVVKEASVDKISVSLNAHEKATYNQVCKPEFENAFEEILEFIEKARENFDTEITTVTISEVDIPKVREIAKRMELDSELDSIYLAFGERYVHNIDDQKL